MFDLKSIKSPDFLKELSIKELEQLSDEIRNFIIENVSHTGGHLSANLGTIEAIIALHYVFDSPHDKIIFDVGHQTYTHKILTGRANEFQSLRSIDGISGFLKYQESIHDVWEAGHSSTAISAASGFLKCKAMGEDIGDVIAFVGDGAIQNGLSFAGLNILGNNKQKAIIILNDNEMSISKNVGALSTLFNKIRIRKSYRWVKKITPRFITKAFMPLKRAIRSLIYKNDLFTDFGFKYIGPIDGHDIKSLIQYLQYCKKIDYPIILHIKTIKGKGYTLSENDTVGKWHGVGPFDIATGRQLKNVSETYSEAVGTITLEIARINPKICVISPAMIYNSGFKHFQEQLPAQIIDVGIAEENAVIMASAMARNGYIPIIPIYSTFLQRSYDQINHDVARVNAHVIFLVDRSGIVGEDGDTHQGIFDIAMLNPLPNFIIAMPSRRSDIYQLLNIAINVNNPFALRYPKGEIEDLPSRDIELGKWIIEKPLEDINIITYGSAVNQFLELLESTPIGLINAIFIKPIDKTLLDSLKGTTVYIYEEVINGASLASSIEHYCISENLQIKIISYSLNEYVSHGNVEEVKKQYNLDIKNIVNRILKG